MNDIGQHLEAKECFLKIIQINPLYSEGYFHLGVTAKYLKEY